MGYPDLISSQVIELRGLAYLTEKRGKGGRWTAGGRQVLTPGQIKGKGFKAMLPPERPVTNDFLRRAPLSPERKPAAFWRLPANTNMLRTWRKGDKVVTGQGAVGTVTGIHEGFARLDADDGYRYIVDWKHAGKVINAVRMTQVTPDADELHRRVLEQQQREAQHPSFKMGPGGFGGWQAGEPQLPRLGQNAPGPEEQYLQRRQKELGGRNAEFGSDSPEVKRLRQLADSGALERGKSTRPHQGVQGDTSVITLPDGSKVVQKVQRSRDRNDAEELSSYVSRAIGANAPAIARHPDFPDTTLVEDYVPGQMAGPYVEKESSDALKEAQSEGAGGWTAEAAASDARDYATQELMSSPEGYKIGLLDYLVSNSDRHDENWMVHDGKPVPIDMGYAQFDAADYESDFTTANGIEDMAAEGGMDDKNWNELYKNLSSLQPEFARLNRVNWYNNMMVQLGELNQTLGIQHGLIPDFGQYANISEQVLDLGRATGWMHEERDTHGRWTHGAELPSAPRREERHGYKGKFEGYDPLVPSMAPADQRKPLELPGRPDGLGTPGDPIDVQGDMSKAVTHMAAGRHVRLSGPGEIGPLLDEVDRQATAQGYSRGNEPQWDLGNISVKGTRLFNEQTLGIPRQEMPQLSGEAPPGTEAALLAGGANKFIELDPEFRAQLRRDGIDVKYERVPAGNLRATQSQLTAATVAGITKAAEGGSKAVRHMLSEPIWVSSDNYVIDGHHRWASDEALAFSGHGPKDIPIQRIGLPIRLAVPYANAFAERMGITGRGLGNAKLVQTAGIADQVLEFRFDPAEARDAHGRWTKAGVIEKIVEPIGLEGKRGNSRAVSHDEFQRLAGEGRQRLHDIQAAPWNTAGMDRDWPAIKNRTWAEVQKSWGGATIDPRTGRDLPQGADKYAMSIKPHGMDTTSIPEHASRAEYDNAMNVAQAKYHNQLSKGGSYLGIFHDDDEGRIDIDPVTVLDSLREVETIGAYTHAIGGAYNFKDGNGYWPPHVAEGASMANEDTHFAGPGQWHSQAVAVQQPHDEPEDEEGDDETPIISAQVLQFGWHDAWLHERRGRGGEWTKGGAAEASFGGLLKKAAHGIGQVYNVGPSDAGLPYIDLPEHEMGNVRAEADKAVKIVPGLLGGDRNEWNGQVRPFNSAKTRHLLAELDWDGTMYVGDNVAQVLSDSHDHPDKPIAAPGAFEILEHELIHGVVPAGTAEANKRAYQEFSVGQIEEGFTELGAIQHMPEYADKMGIGNRPSGEAEGYTVRQVAAQIAHPDNIKAGNAWGHYETQTKDAEQWVEVIARNEGQTDFTPGSLGYARTITLADEINRNGAAGKVRAMARQMAYSVTDNPKLRSNEDFMENLMDTVEQDIHDQWSVGQADAVTQQLRANAQTRVQQAERELAERGTLAA